MQAGGAESATVSTARSIAGTTTTADDGRLRRLWFAFLQRIVLPPGLVLLKAWLRTCRCSIDGAADMERGLASERLIVAVLHSSMIHMLALAQALGATRRRRFFVLLSSSLDGQLLARGLRSFDVGHAFGAAGEDGERGGRRVIRRVGSGEVAIIAVDGPTGPAGVVKPGLALLVRASGAELLVVHTTARHGWRFPSWDRCHVPWPFSKVHFTIRRLPAAPPPADVVPLVEQFLAHRRSSRRDADAMPSTPSSGDEPKTTARGSAK